MGMNRYKNYRKEIEEHFDNPKIIGESTEEHLSPSGKYSLKIEYIEKSEGWDYSKGTVYSLENNKIISEVKRNYGMFWYTWVMHSNNNEYLLCGEDYQGYTTINLTKGNTHIYFPESGYKGSGFCWASAHPSPDNTLLAVDGCYWACPYDLVLFDFKEPDNLPYREIKRIDSIDDFSGWNEDNSGVVTREVEVRKSDKKPYEELTDEEQTILDSNSSLVEYVKKKVTIKVADINQELN